jgi:5-methylcytosine-specific restriction endonuclease McrA
MRDGGICQICKEPVYDADIEIDHFPIAYHRGGKTVTENGRLVHKTCHPRYGRPVSIT